MSLRNLKTRWKLTLLTMAICLLTVSVATGVVVYQSVGSFTDNRTAHLQSLAKFTVFNLEAAVAFEQEEAIADLLNSFRSQEFVVHARVETEKGKTINYFRSPGDEKLSFPKPEESNYQQTQEHLILRTPITVEDSVVGQLYLVSDLVALEHEINAHIRQALYVLFLSAVVAALLSLYFQGVVTKPLNAILTATQAITERKDYSARVEQDREDEFGELTKSFNRMLAEVERRDKNLEQIVSERTLSLEKNYFILERLASGVSRDDVLTLVIREIERLVAGAEGSILGLSPQGTLHSIVAPQVSGELVEMFDGIEIGENVGSCGTAAYLGQPVIVSDVIQDPLWEKYREIAREYSIAACWSVPIFSSSQDILGTFALYFRETRDATEQELAILGRSAHLAAVVLEHHETQNQLRREKERAEAASRAKSQFLTNMSHEIRTPMNGVLGMAELLAATHLNDDQKDLLDTIRNSGEHLLSIINDILHFSKIQAGKFELDMRPNNLLTVVHKIERMLEAKVREKDLAFISVFEPEILDCLLLDDIRLTQVLVNLLGNAIKFTHIGGAVVFKCEVIETNERQQTIAFHVSDTGVGISEEFKDHIFAAFSQADNTVTREYGGTGLGLSISKSLVFLMGGELSFSSSKGTGTVFSFTLTFDRAVATEEEEVSVPEQAAFQSEHKYKILVAEDNKVNQKLVKRMLENRGHEVRVVENGALAVSAFTEGSYDLVFMDIQMPVMDGREAFKLIRQLPHGQKVPIVALTAHASKEHRELYLGLGMDGYLTKPLRSVELDAQIHDCMRKSGGGEDVSADREVGPESGGDEE